jgi:hypothetical protein
MWGDCVLWYIILHFIYTHQITLWLWIWNLPYILIRGWQSYSNTQNTPLQTLAIPIYIYIGVCVCVCVFSHKYQLAMRPSTRVLNTKVRCISPHWRQPRSRPKLIGIRCICKLFVIFLWFLSCCATYLLTPWSRVPLEKPISLRS